MPGRAGVAVHDRHARLRSRRHRSPAAAREVPFVLQAGSEGTGQESRLGARTDGERALTLVLVGSPTGDGPGEAE
jgi:hypothetical protein